MSPTTHSFQSNQKLIYEAALSNTPDFVYMIGIDRRFFYANKALLDTWGMTSEQIMGKTLLELGYEPWHAAMHEREIDEILETRKPIRGEVPFTGTNGTRIYDYIFSPVFDDGGTIIAISGTTRDVTARKQIEDALRKSEERTALALSASEFIGIWDWDITKNIVACDDRFARFYGVDPDRVPNGVPVEDFLALIHPEDVERVSESIRQAIQVDQEFAQEYRLQRQDGSIRWVVARGRAQFDAQGNAVHFPGVAIDITDRKIAENNLRLREEQLRQTTDAIPQQVWTARPDGQLDYINDYCLKYVGEITLIDGVINWLSLIHPDDVPHSMEGWLHSVKTGEPYECQQRVFHKPSSTFRWNLTRALPVRDDHGTIIKWYGTNTDIEDQKKASEAEQRVRAHLEMTLEAASDGVWSYELNTKAVYWSDRFKQLIGQSPEWNTSIEKWRDLLHPEDAEFAAGRLRAHIEGYTPTYECVYRLRHTNGSYRWMHSRGKASYDAHGTPTRVSGGITDITHRKEAEIALAKSEQRWRAITEAVPQLVWIANTADGACDYMSSQWSQYTGVALSDMLGFGWLSFVHPSDVERTMLAWTDAREGRSDYNIEYRIRHRDGHYRWFKVRGVPIRDEDGNLTQWYGTCTDIHDLKEAEVRAEAANLAKSEFLANMSHEIRTPMNAVIGLSNILAMSEPLTPKQREFIKTLQTSGDSLLLLINDLLDIAKIEARTVDLETIPFSLTQLVQEVVSMLQPRAQEKGLRFDDNCASVPKRTFMGDPTRLRQVLLNLCSNAIKFTERGAVTISITYGPLEGTIQPVRIAIRDTGIGIPAEKFDTIFHKFVQADSSINRKYGGTGLGLAITKTLAEIMGGTVYIESEIGAGSTFTISIPLEIADIAPATYVAEATHLSEPAIPVGTSKQRILLVEDYRPNILVATTFLEQFGYECAVAMNGIQAIEKVKEGDFMAVLMDVQMHGLNGLEATIHIRERERLQRVPPVHIIGMTAHALAGDRERCLSAGMDDYIAKPFNPDELKAKLKALEPQMVTS